jgi:hypothetical protein
VHGLGREDEQGVHERCAGDVELRPADDDAVLEATDDPHVGVGIGLVA